MRTAITRCCSTNPGARPPSMAKTHDNERPDMRAAAEARLRERKRGRAPTYTSREQHELEVHQIELELQNEELLESRQRLEMALADRNELFDFAPIGYAVIAHDDTIREINHIGARLLGQTRSEIVGRRFRSFIAVATHFAFDAALALVMVKRDSVTCELGLRLSDR